MDLRNSGVHVQNTQIGRTHILTWETSLTYPVRETGPPRPNVFLSPGENQGPGGTVGVRGRKVQGSKNLPAVTAVTGNALSNAHQVLDPTERGEGETDVNQTAKVGLTVTRVCRITSGRLCEEVSPSPVPLEKANTVWVSGSLSNVPREKEHSLSGPRHEWSCPSSFQPDSDLNDHVLFTPNNDSSRPVGGGPRRFTLSTSEYGPPGAGGRPFSQSRVVVVRRRHLSQYRNAGPEGIPRLTFDLNGRSVPVGVGRGPRLGPHECHRTVCHSSSSWQPAPTRRGSLDLSLGPWGKQNVNYRTVNLAFGR